MFQAVLSHFFEIVIVNLIFFYMKIKEIEFDCILNNNLKFGLFLFDNLLFGARSFPYRFLLYLFLDFLFFLLDLVLFADLVIGIHDRRVRHKGCSFFLFLDDGFGLFFDNNLILIIEKLHAIVLFGYDAHMDQIYQAFFVQNFLAYRRPLRPRIRTLFFAEYHGRLGDVAQMQLAFRFEIFEAGAACPLEDEFVLQGGKILCSFFELV